MEYDVGKAITLTSLQMAGCSPTLELIVQVAGETLLRLEATFAEVRHVLQITEEEFDWLERCEHAAGVRRTTHGNLQIVQEEIDTHYVSEYLPLYT